MQAPVEEAIEYLQKHAPLLLKRLDDEEVTSAEDNFPLYCGYVMVIYTVLKKRDKTPLETQDLADLEDIDNGKEQIREYLGNLEDVGFIQSEQNNNTYEYRLDKPVSYWQEGSEQGDPNWTEDGVLEVPLSKLNRVQLPSIPLSQEFADLTVITRNYVDYVSPPSDPSGFEEFEKVWAEISIGIILLIFTLFSFGIGGHPAFIAVTAMVLSISVSCAFTGFVFTQAYRISQQISVK